MSHIVRAVLNCPDLSTARNLAAALLEARLVACANIYPQIESHYVWQGERVSENEVPLVLKTTEELFPRLEQLVLQMHPYDVPPLVAQRLDFVTQTFEAWVQDVTGAL